jgi:polyhydroxyalkanoate synthesis regulator protein
MKYQNRKYYSPQEKRYMTLIEVASLPAGSYAVFEHKTKRNITEEVYFDGLIALAKIFPQKSVMTKALRTVFGWRE